MSNEKIDAAIYTKYRTLCRIPAEMLWEYSTQSKWAQADELYGKVKQKIMKLPASEVEKKIEQMNLLLQNILDDKELFVLGEKMQQMASDSVQSKKMIENANNGFYVKEQPNSGFFVRENVLGEKETLGTEKKDYNAKILELMKLTCRTYSKNLKQDAASLQNARKNFYIPNETKIYYVFDWTLLGTCKEGLAICSDGLHYKFDVSVFPNGIIRWEALSQYDIQLYGPGRIQLKAKWNRKDAIFYFLQNVDAIKFIEILHKMQKL